MIFLYLAIMDLLIYIVNIDCKINISERNVMTRQSYSAKEAAAQLGITRATLYAYVSRGLIRSEEGSERSRARRYNAEDVQRLKARKENPSALVEQALQWGAPLLESGLTLITEGRLYYRGYDAALLAQQATLEKVAGLLWADHLDDDLFGEAFALSERLRGVLVRVADLRAVERMQGMLIVATGEDDSAFDLRPQAVHRTGTRILRLMTCGAMGQSAEDFAIATALQQAWSIQAPGAAELLNAALILCADHELNVSAFTARCVASAGSNPYATVIAGLSALQGVKHGGHTERVEALLREIGEPPRSSTVLADRLRRGEVIPGFGHRLYPEGDPRAAVLLSMLHDHLADSAALALADAVMAAAADLIELKPTVDFALAVMARALALPEGAALALFALGRAVGWIGHALEQYESDQLIRPRARYSGRQPIAESQRD